MIVQLGRRLGPADGVTLVNAVLGFLAAVVAFSDPHAAARLLLLAVMVDALDGIVARNAGNTEIGPLLDSITDVVSFGATPALFVFGVVRADRGGLGTLDPGWLVAVLAAGAAFVVFSLLRTAYYTVYVDDGEARPGIANTLGGTILAAAYLTGLVPTVALVAATPVLAVLMVVPVRYPDLRERDAVLLGAVLVLAVAAPDVAGGAFPLALLGAALAYLLLAPRFYWAEQPANGA